MNLLLVGLLVAILVALLHITAGTPMIVLMSPIWFGLVALIVAIGGGGRDNSSMG